MVKISVIIPVYNASLFLKESISSVLNQTFEDIELICVNDGSTDNSLSILEEFSKNDNRVIVINQKNAGCGAARNKALNEAKGDYIYFFDPDDYILPSTFEDLYNNAIKNDSDLVIFKIARFRDNEPIDYSNPGFDFESVFKGENFDNFSFDYHKIKKYVLNASFAPWTKLYKKKFLDEYDDFRFPTDVAFDDVPFHVKSLLRASKISFVPQFYYHYRFNPNSINNTSSNGISIFEICNIVERFLKENDYYWEFIHEFKLFKLTQILNYLLSTGTEEYFNLAKSEFSKLSFNKHDTIDGYLKEQHKLVITSDNLKDFEVKEYNLKLDFLKKDKKKLQKSANKLTKKNKKLKKQLKNVKRLNKEIKESNSWKATYGLRKLLNH